MIAVQTRTYYFIRGKKADLRWHQLYFYLLRSTTHTPYSNQALGSIEWSCLFYLLTTIYLWLRKTEHNVRHVFCCFLFYKNHPVRFFSFLNQEQEARGIHTVTVQRQRDSDMIAMLHYNIWCCDDFGFWSGFFARITVRTRIFRGPDSETYYVVISIQVYSITLRTCGGIFPIFPPHAIVCIMIMKKNFVFAEFFKE